MNSKAMFLVFSILFSCIAFAQIPGIPHKFYGSVFINGAPAPDGALVEAKISGITVASTTTLGGKYGESPASVFYISDPNNNRQGSIISFFVNGVNSGQTYIYQNGDSTRLDLYVSIVQPPPSGGGSSGGSSSGGGGSFGGILTTTKNNTNSTNNTNVSTSLSNEKKECIERWLCTDWSACNDGMQTRQCEDVNKCGTYIYSPMESQPCVIEAQKTVPITGFVVADASIIGGIIALIIVVILIAYWLMKKRKK